MSHATHRIDAKQVVVRLQMPRAFGFRMWLAIKVLRLAGFIAPVTIAIETGDDTIHRSHTP